MPLTPFQTLTTILAVALATVLTRFLPFWLFPQRRQHAYPRAASAGAQGGDSGLGAAIIRLKGA